MLGYTDNKTRLRLALCGAPPNMDPRIAHVPIEQAIRTSCKHAVIQLNPKIIPDMYISPDIIPYVPLSLDLMQWSAKNGFRTMIEALHEHRCPWNERVFSAAAYKGHLEVLQYLHTNECPWDATACASAARGGHLEALQYLHANECPWDVCREAAGNLETLKYVHQRVSLG